MRPFEEMQQGPALCQLCTVFMTDHLCVYFRAGDRAPPRHCSGGQESREAFLAPAYPGQHWRQADRRLRVFSKCKTPRGAGPRSMRSEAQMTGGTADKAQGMPSAGGPSGTTNPPTAPLPTRAAWQEPSSGSARRCRRPGRGESWGRSRPRLPGSGRLHSPCSAPPRAPVTAGDPETLPGTRGSDAPPPDPDWTAVPTHEPMIG